MSKANAIRAAFSTVAELRMQARASPALGQALTAVKAFQSQRFAGSYADELAGGHFEVATRFFLTELYSDKDYTERDHQFTRIAGPLDKLFPARVSDLAVSLAQLHALTETLDFEMAKVWLQSAAPRSLAGRASLYIQTWRTVGRAPDRHHQLHTVIGIGEELARLTRLRGLRSLVRMMRGAAAAAGLSDLHHFLETGFDTFAALGQQPGGTAAFLSQIQARENALIHQLFDDELVTCETALAHTLGLAR